MKQSSVQNKAMREHPDSAGLTGKPEVPFGSNCVRLSGREWIVVGMVVSALFFLGPPLWERLEKFAPGPDYRLPYVLSSDYWHYERYCRWASSQYETLVIGDSVVWGHYVSQDHTLSHYLNEMAGDHRFANLGVDGIHPAALDGLLRYYGKDISNKNVILHLNPLWMSTPKHDLQSEKEFRFNHPRLVPQFTPRIACYTESLPNRISIVMERNTQLLSWASHVRTAYFNKLDLSSWTMQHPYEFPLRALTFELPQPKETSEQDEPWDARGATQQSFPWVGLESSVQWKFFRHAVENLREHGNTVFVLIGPFNEHMLKDKSLEAYRSIKASVETWLRENRVPYYLPGPLPSDLYADASHPLDGGYAMLARRLFDDKSFKSVVLSPGGQSE